MHSHQCHICACIFDCACKENNSFGVNNTCDKCKRLPCGGNAVIYAQASKLLGDNMIQAYTQMVISTAQNVRDSCFLITSYVLAVTLACA